MIIKDSGGGGGDSRNPNEQFGFEVVPGDGTDGNWSFAPFYYPERFTEAKEQDLERHNSTCAGETVTLEQVKNREFHVTGIVLRGERGVFRKLQEHRERVDIVSPLVDGGGKECLVKKAELGEMAGWDPLAQEHTFEYTIDLIATGNDEHEDGDNGIVTGLMQSERRQDVMDNLPYYEGDDDGE